MKFEYIKFWLRWYWLPYQESTVLDLSFRWLCFELGLKRQPTQRALDEATGVPQVWNITPAKSSGTQTYSSLPPRE